MIKYTNGNAKISLSDNGTRVIEYPDVLSLEYPLNIDIRVQTKCAFGYNPSTGKAFCSFCHESARTDGKECDYEELKLKLCGLPKGIELAIGCNELTESLFSFIVWCYCKKYVVNLTINQGHINRDKDKISKLLYFGFIKGLGISYRPELKFDIPKDFLKNENVVFHVIVGIDSFETIFGLSDKGVKKILVLGEKDFGFNSGNVDLTTQSHKEWFWWIHKFFNKFDVVSFDNLALEQLKIRRFFSEDNWNKFNNGEHSMYIDAVNEIFAPSSRSNLKTKWDTTIKQYFKTKELIS